MRTGCEDGGGVMLAAYGGGEVSALSDASTGGEERGGVAGTMDVVDAAAMFVVFSRAPLVLRAWSSRSS